MGLMDLAGLGEEEGPGTLGTHGPAQREWVWRACRRVRHHTSEAKGTATGALPHSGVLHKKRANKWVLRLIYIYLIEIECNIFYKNEV